jgi:hypothetical protein
MWPFPSDFTYNVLSAFIAPIYAECPTHPIILDLITLFISGEEDKSWKLRLLNNSVIMFYSERKCNFDHSCD